ncbi:MAG: hypothetical protein ACFFFB_18990, partial [Candidatus Heimdallarchaeota archaeon]
VEVRYWWPLFPLIGIILMITSLFLPWMLVTIDYLPNFYLQDGFLLFGGILVSLEPFSVLYPEMLIVLNLLRMLLIIFGAALMGYTLLLLISTIWVIKSNKGIKKAKIMWLVIGLLLLSNQIIQLAIYNINFLYISRHFPNPLTVRFTVDIGMIFLIFGSVILILGYILAKRIGQNRLSEKPINVD